MNNQNIHITGIDTHAEYYTVAYYPDLIGSPFHFYAPESSSPTEHVAVTLRQATCGDPIAFAAAMAVFDHGRNDQIKFTAIAPTNEIDSASSRIWRAESEACLLGMDCGFFVHASRLHMPHLTKSDLPFAMSPAHIAKWHEGCLVTNAESTIMNDCTKMDGSIAYRRSHTGPVVSYLSEYSSDGREYPWCGRNHAFVDTAANLPLGHQRSRFVPYYSVRNLEYLAMCFTDLRLDTWYLVSVKQELCSVENNPKVRELLGVPEHQFAGQTSPYFLRPSSPFVVESMRSSGPSDHKDA